MWHKHLDNNYFISKLYDEVPEIINTKILKIQINREGEELSLTYNGKESLSGDIKIESNDNGLLDVSISGTVNLTFKAYAGFIQSVKGLIVETLEK